MAAGSPALDDVEQHSFAVKDFRLESGAVLPEARLAYETYGRLAADGRNGVVLTHGLHQQPPPERVIEQAVASGATRP